MQVSVRANVLREALERATGEVATTTGKAPGAVRITVTIPERCTDEQWAAVLQVLRSVARWGASDGAGRTVVWAEVQEDPC
ncbi:hypothetical protein [Kitasatospora sp. DSM 101779]|uniref:hypothetical protein n=1 Tax=Kitasatospora sp. DSM 101779 TaxID=2853165 RepID=UPI0021D8C03E|nr:hypothetical protein [Kitasatospora sp. DSM 101779]MCU7825467.1 hypothetical protein [Kitasatospora sp. DSM 101779]